MAGRRPAEQDDVLVEQRAEQKLERPRLYRVVLHNDDYTTMEFVVYVLMTVFRKSPDDSVRIMLEVHQRGSGIAGVFTREVAETKVETVLDMARQAEYPLQCSMEPE